MTAMITSNYNQILHRKRNEERKHRQINGMDNIEEDIEEEITNNEKLIEFLFFEELKFNYLNTYDKMNSSFEKLLMTRDYKLKN
jgi:hypothetical protein